MSKTPHSFITNYHRLCLQMYTDWWSGAQTVDADQWPTRCTSPESTIQYLWGPQHRIQLAEHAQPSHIAWKLHPFSLVTLCLPGTTVLEQPFNFQEANHARSKLAQFKKQPCKKQTGTIPLQHLTKWILKSDVYLPGRTELPWWGSGINKDAVIDPYSMGLHCEDPYTN